MIDPLTGMTIAKAGSSIFNWLANRRKTRFDDTAYAKRLRERMKHGRYDPQAESRIIGGVAKSAGNVAQKAAASYRGRLASRGMESSIAGERGIADIETRPIEAVTQTRERIATEDELARETARDEYAAAKTSYRERLDELNRRNTAGLVGGLVDAGAGYLVGKSQQAAFKKFGGDPTKWAATQTDPMGAMERVTDIEYKQALAKRYHGGQQKIEASLDQFKDRLGNWDMGKIQQYITTLSPEQASKFIDELGELGIIRDPGILGF